MTRAVSIDGVLVPPERATISVYDRGFLYGDAVFEVLRVYAGKPFALGEHLARLSRSAATLGIVLPVSEADLAREIGEAIQSAGAGAGDAYLRVMITRGSGALGLDPSRARDPKRVILVEPLVVPSRETYANGVTAVTVPFSRANDAIAGAKIQSYVASIVASEVARSRGAAEAILVDPGGHLLEGATSNVFLVDAEGELATPPTDDPILAGITRAHLLACARELGMPARERKVHVDELARAREVFLASSIREVLSVVSIDGRPVGSGSPGPVASALHEALRRRAGAGTITGDVP